jgi:hypothetical protein
MRSSKQIVYWFIRFVGCSIRIYGYIRYGPVCLGGWWSGGIVYLEIADPIPDRLTLLGVTWLDSLGTAHFEIDMVHDPINGTLLTKTGFRIGMLDNEGRPIVCDRNLVPNRVVELRPRYNRDWAMAFELTPSPRNATGQSEPPNLSVSRDSET